MGMLLKIAKILKLTDEIKIYRKKGAEIGENCKFYNVKIDGGHTYLIKIGNNTTLTNCTILTHDASTKMYLNKTRVGKVIIGDRCFIGLGAIILPNVKIGNDCIIGAGSVVTKDIPENSVVAGNPARIIMQTEEFKKKHEKYLKEKPIFDTYWKNKSEIQKKEEIILLNNTFGYDE